MSLRSVMYLEHAVIVNHVGWAILSQHCNECRLNDLELTVHHDILESH